MRTSLIFVLVLLLAGPALAEEKPAKSFEELCREGDRLVEDGKLDEAAKLYVKAARANPSSAEPLVGLARLELRRALAARDRNLINRALLLLREAGSREPTHGGIAFVRGEIALALRDHKGAVHAFRGAIQREYRVRQAEVLLARSLVYWAADQAKGGRVPHDEVIDVFAEARRRIEALQKDETRTEDEQKLLDRLFKMTLNNMAAVHQRARELPKAQAVLEELVAAEPKHASYRFALGLVLGDQRLYDQAMVQYRKALELSEDPDWVDPYRPMGHIASQKDEVEKAEEYFRKFLAKRPDDWDGLMRYGDHLLRHGKAEAAVKVYTRAVEVDRKRFAAVRKLGDALVRAGDAAQAEKWRALYRILEREREEFERSREPR